MSNGPVEPSALMREAARNLHEIYVALIQEGFGEHQALTIVGQIIATQQPGGTP